MEKQKRWQLYLILAVMLLTVYNILPTLFFYSNSLKKPIGQKEATQVAQGIVERVNDLEEFTLAWLRAQSKNLGLKPTAISLDPVDPRLAQVTFRNDKEAAFFAKTLQRAGALIPFVPAQLGPDPRSFEPGSKQVIVQRRIGVHLDPNKLETYFHFVPKTTETGAISPEYRTLVSDRVLQLALGFGGESTPGRLLIAIAADQASDEDVIHLARNIIEYENAFGDQHPITKRYFASFTQVPASENHQNLIHKFTARLETLSQKIVKNSTAIRGEQAKLQGEGKFLTSAQQQKLEILESQKNLLQSAASIVKRNSSAFEKGTTPITREALLQVLNTPIPQDKVQRLDIGTRNPFIASLEIDWNKDLIQLLLQPDVTAIRERAANNEIDAIQLEKLNQFLFNDIASVARTADEAITPSLSHFVVSLNKLTNSSSLLTLDIGAIAETQSTNVAHLLANSWQPSDKELSHNDYPIYDWAAFKKLTPQTQKLGLVIYAPAMEKTTEEGFRGGSLYVIARGLNTIRQKYQDLPASAEKENGFIGYSGASADLPSKYHNDYIFELGDYYSYLLAATREEFTVKGSKKLAVLEFTDVEQRILTLNKIETRQHEDLLKWRDEYRQAQVSVDSSTRYDIPRPTQNVLWDNLKLSFRKYFRGDDRKILKWGLDLSGGKTVRVGLKDQNNQMITNEDDMKQAVNELYQRVNRLGVSEVGIRIEGSTIVLDFPGSQGLSASDLIQASAMYFHVVNEKFSSHNPMLREAVNTFLEEVWNEAVITSRTDPENLNEIAWLHLGGDPENPGEFHPNSPDLFGLL